MILQAYNISTLATKVGIPNIAKGATAFLLINYGHAVATALLSARGAFNMVPMIGGHLALAAVLVKRFMQLDATSIPSVKVYYKHIWDLFYLEYALYTLI